MAITQTSLRIKGATDGAVTLLDASDQFIYQPSGEQVMLLHNPTASAISPLLTGNNVSSAFKVPTVGDIDLTEGFEVGEIQSGQTVAIPLDTVRYWINGERSFINSGAGLECSIYTRDTVPNVPDLLWIDGGKLISAGILTVNSKLWGL